MKKVLLISLLLLVVFSCKDDEGTQETSIKISRVDTFIVKEEIVKGMFEYSSRGRQTRYFIVNGSDTSSLRPTFFQEYDSGAVKLFLIDFDKNELLSKERKLNELKQIFETANHDYPLDSLTSIASLGFLLTIDLRIDITKKINEKGNQKGYDFIQDYLFNSRITKEINNLLLPYKKSVEGYLVEKILVLPNEMFLSDSIMNIESNDIPEKLISFGVWVELKNN